LETSVTAPRLVVIVSLIFALLVVPLAAQTQQARAPRVALVATTSPVSEMVGPEPANPAIRAFVHRLLELGWTEGRNIAFERRSAEGRPERYPEIMTELVRLAVNAIVTSDTATARAAQQATRTIPIVMGAGGDPVEAGLVTSLARPGGNLTGFILAFDAAISGKQLQLLKELAPRMARVVVIHQTSDYARFRNTLEAQAQALGLSLLWTAVDRPDQFSQVLVTISRERAEAIFALTSAQNFAWRHQLADLGAKARLPALYGHVAIAQAGGLMAYAPDAVDNYRRAAEYVDRILRGARPGDLPIQRPARFHLVVNLRTAKAVGLTIPPSLLLQADEIIE
jgi:putative ABC transport system substrate-binding protein